MRHPRNESGFTLIAALLTMFIIAGLGMALLTLTDAQQHAASREQFSETAFNIAEAAMNAQIGQLARQWPAVETQEYPPSCTPSGSTTTNGCPTAEGLEKAYPPSGSASSPEHCRSSCSTWSMTRTGPMN